MRKIKLRKSAALALTFATAISLTPLQIFDSANAKTPKPTKAQIDAAKAAEAAKAQAAAAAQSQLNLASSKLHQLAGVAQAAAKSLQAAQATLNQATAKSIAATNAYQKALDQVSAANQTIGRLASNAYIMGSGFTDLESVLHSTGPQDLIDRLSTLNTLGASNSVALANFKNASLVAHAAKVSADSAKAAQQAATNRVAAAKSVADSAKAAQQKEVNRLQAVQNDLAKQLAAARNVRVTLEQQLQLALLEEANAAKATTISGQAKVWPDRGFTGRTSIRSNDTIRAAAVAYAKAQVLARKPYVWGTQGPNTFDCSGLVYAAYKAAGMGWPNWSRLNAALYFVDSKRIPFSQLVPGDLLFYSFDGSVQNIHHITIYAGNGMMWEANSKGRGLLYSNMYSIPGLMPSGGRV